MMTKTMPVSIQTDAELVHETLTGNRDAFGQIVSRYQSLVCSLAYSATGSLGQSEDLAQETFITAWKHLRQLRERDKLRSWLCGIARNRINNFLRREGREPQHKAEPIDNIPDSCSPEPLPVDHAITSEEQAILWSALERIPETYREPLILFYREHQSIEAVAASLELSEDAVKQRLSRGRKLLQDQIAAFVEGALERTIPGKAFTFGVMAALPATLSTSIKTVALTAAATKGTATAKSMGLMGFLSFILSPLMILFGNYIPYQIGMAEAKSEEERKLVSAFFHKIWLITLGLFTPIAATALWFGWSRFRAEDMFNILFSALVIIYLFAIFSLSIITSRKRRAFYSKILETSHHGRVPGPAFEYCSKMRFLGLPLVHIRVGDRFDILRKPVTGWIVFSHYAVAGLFAFGGVAIAPISIGGLALGTFALGGFAFGIFPAGGLAVGLCAFGGLAIGWQAFGCGAMAWNAAAGNLAIAHDFAIGNVCHAFEAGTDTAHQFIRSQPFFRCMRSINHYWCWLNLLWITPLLIQWWLIAKSRSKPQAAGANNQ